MELTPAELTALVGLVSMIIGTIGGRLIDNIINNKKLRVDEVLALREDIDEADENLDHWKSRYFDLREKNLELESTIDKLEIQLKKYTGN